MEIGTYRTLVLIWIALAIIIFPVLLKVSAPYGRHTKSSWGPMINNKLGWFIMELPALVVFLGFALFGSRTLGFDPITLFVTLWAMHYTYRSLIFPMLIKTGKKKMPVAIMLFAMFFNLVNGSINGYWFGSLSPGYPEGWLTDIRFVAGIGLFVFGFAVHSHHDNLLIKLRKNSSTGYKIPHGGLFRYISCPNFLGEIIQWGGFALMTWCLPTLSFFVWTFVNLLPRALDHHKWYKSTFQDYPSNRKAMIPFIL